MNQIYLDHNATTPILPQVSTYISEISDYFGNPSSMHKFGRKTKVILETSRQILADYFSTSSENVLFTSSGSESNNMILKHFFLKIILKMFI